MYIIKYGIIETCASQGFLIVQRGLAYVVIECNSSRSNNVSDEIEMQTVKDNIKGTLPSNKLHLQHNKVKYHSIPRRISIHWIVSGSRNSGEFYDKHCFNICSSYLFIQASCNTIMDDDLVHTVTIELTGLNKM